MPMSSSFRQMGGANFSSVVAWNVLATSGHGQTSLLAALAMWPSSEELVMSSSLLMSAPGWSGGANLLVCCQCRGVIIWINGRTRANCACSRCGWVCLDNFSLSYPFFFLPLRETALYRLKYCLKGN